VSAAAGGVAIGGAILLGNTIGHHRTIQVIVENPSDCTFRVCDVHRDVGDPTYPAEIPPKSVANLVWRHQGPGVGSYIAYKEKSSNGKPNYMKLGASNPFVGENKLYVRLSTTNESAK